MIRSRGFTEYLLRSAPGKHWCCWQLESTWSLVRNALTANPLDVFWSLSEPLSTLRDLISRASALNDVISRVANSFSSGFHIFRLERFDQQLSSHHGLHSIIQFMWTKPLNPFFRFEWILSKCNPYLRTFSSFANTFHGNIVSNTPLHPNQTLQLPFLLLEI